ncbi:MAG: AI-2E family transporter [Candidatus Methylacidiphilales bacterium]
MAGRTAEEHFKKQLAFFTMLLFGGFLFYLLSGFFSAFLGAVIFYEIFKKPMQWLVEKHHWPKTITVLLVIVFSLFMIIIPIILCLNALYHKVSVVINDPTSLLSVVSIIGEKIKTTFGYDIYSDQTIALIKNYSSSMIPSVLNKSLSILGQLLIMYFILFYLLYNYKELPNYLSKYLPLDKQNIKIFLDELASMTISNVVGTPILAIIQSASAVLAFYIFGVPEPVFWGVMCGVFSFIPFVGSAIIWIPAGIYLLSSGVNWQGIGILAYGALVISNVDNLFRFVFQKKFANVHPLVTVFGVIIGIQLFGLPGFIFGPLLISYFLIGIGLYQKAYNVPQP